MPLSLITFDNKEDNRTVDVAAKYKVSAADINEIKTVVNALAAAMNSDLRKRICVTITASDFTGGYYTNTNAIGLTPDSDIHVFSNEGSGNLLNEGSGKGYVFTANLGRFTMTPGNYSITIFKPL